MHCNNDDHMTTGFGSQSVMKTVVMPLSIGYAIWMRISYQIFLSIIFGVNIPTAEVCLIVILSAACTYMCYWRLIVSSVC